MVQLRSGVTTDEDGSDAPAGTAIGLLRKLLFFIILDTFNGGLMALLVKYGMEDDYKKIWYQLSYFHLHGCWDTRPRIGNPGVRHSPIRKCIVSLYNTIGFPVRLKVLQDELLKIGRRIAPNRILHYLNQIEPIYKRLAQTIANACKIEQCRKRFTRAKTMKVEINALYRKWCAAWKQKTDFLWYYYDQSPMNQIEINEGVFLAPRGTKIYDPTRSKSKTTSATLHMICDQYGRPFYYEVALQGQGEEKIREFLLKVQDKLPTASIVYFDNLRAHVNIHDNGLTVKKRPKSFEFRLTPVCTPDTSVVEYSFREIKSFIRQKLAYQTESLGAEEWKTLVKEYVDEWADKAVYDDAKFQETKKYIAELVTCKGSLQKIGLRKVGIKHASQLVIKQLDVDQ